MNLIRAAIDRPIAVLAAVLMAVMFGWVALLGIPIQLAPDVERPIITVTTFWPGAAPAEIEREIVNRQEEVFKGLDGLERLTSSSKDDEGQVTLEFSIETDMDRALLLTANRLDRVGNYPDEVDEPTLSTSGDDDNAIAWFVMKRTDPAGAPVHTFGDVAEDLVQDRLQRVSGVARVDVFGGSEREMQVTALPERLAQYRLTVPDMVDALRAGGVSMSAGDVEEGKRRYVVRTDGDYETPEDVAAVVLRTMEDARTGRLARVTVGDVAEVGFAYKKPSARIRVMGENALVARAIRETGANVIETMRGVRAAVVELNAGPLPDAGLVLEQVYDETVYIDSAIDLVTSNIYVGGTLAALMLLLFLRSLGATLIVSIAIPVSVIASFVAMAAMGRSINVISLAGIAFAVGMVVDAAIVVLENIYRLRQNGMAPAEAAYEGARQVWGAILVSAMTTVMVFIPILVMQLEVGQLFRDIAVAISVAVLLSLLVAVTLVPAMAKKLLGGADGSLVQRRLPIVDDVAHGFASFVLAFIRRVAGNRALALVVVAGVTAAAGGTAWFFLPKLDYLPEGNQNLVFGFILPPPGYNLETMTAIGRRVEDATRPHWAASSGAEGAGDEEPRIERFFFAAFGGAAFLGASALDQQAAGALVPVLGAPLASEPGTFGFIRQPSIFGRGLEGTRGIDLDISGPDLAQTLGTALRAMGLVAQTLPREAGHQYRPDPGLELGAPEIRLTPDPVRLADAGVSARTFGLSVDAFNDGVRVEEITVGSERMDLMLKGPDDLTASTQSIDGLPIVTRSGEILPAGALASIEVTAGPTQIRHIERERTVTLKITPAAALPLEDALALLQTQVIDVLRAQGLPPGIDLSLSGTADQLSATFEEMKIDLLLALVIVFLVMAVLFESFVYPFIIMFSVPLAAAGGVAGLAVLNLFTFQSLDMLTLLGFVILIGIVVNNAILLVHQTLHHLRVDGMAPAAAIVEATRNRLRPIFMSTLTSVFGMLPLVLFPGAGSELYRGLGSVVVGGLSLSAILTLLLIPPLLSLALIRREKHTAPARHMVGAPAE
ncbi:MAG: efflux RND transporter permease subunit [Geminicoccaceae bacterium]|nr:efflux RND transporter permease subunit [Geminicoccaceae bacterium]